MGAIEFLIGLALLGLILSALILVCIILGAGEDQWDVP